MHTQSIQTESQSAQLANPMLRDRVQTSAASSSLSSDTNGSAALVFGVMSAKLTSWNFAQDSWRVD